MIENLKLDPHNNDYDMKITVIAMLAGMVHQMGLDTKKPTAHIETVLLDIQDDILKLKLENESEKA